MPDGSATHAMLWVAKTDLNSKQGQPYNGRFLNIAAPWSDKRLLNWKGYSETRYFDAENRLVTAETSGARAVELIRWPLTSRQSQDPEALVDLPRSTKPKARDVRRALEDVTKKCWQFTFWHLSTSGRTVFDSVPADAGWISTNDAAATYAN